MGGCALAIFRLDHAAVGAYTEAIDSLETMPSVRDPLLRYRGDHERHILDLSAVVRRLGGKPSEKPDHP